MPRTATFCVIARKADGWRFNLTITRLHTESESLGLITARDMRVQREAQAQLKNKEAQLRQVLASVSDCLWSAELDVETGQWQMAYMSPVIETITGRPPDFFRPGLERIYDIIHTDDLPRVKLTDQRLLTGLARSEDDFRIIRPDATLRWLRGSKQTHRGAGGVLRLTACSRISPSASKPRRPAPQRGAVPGVHGQQSGRGLHEG